MAYKITLADVRAFMRIRHVRVEPPADSTILLIAGKNKSGKTSLFRALALLFGGGDEAPKEPIHTEPGADGKPVAADQAVILVVIEGDEKTPGRFELRRVIRAGKPDKIEVRGPAGLVKSPAAFIASVIGKRTLNPLAFIAGDKAEDDRRRRLALLRAVGVDTLTIDHRKEEAYTKRRDIGRDLTRAKATLDGLPPVESAPPPARPIAAVTADLVTVEGDLRSIVAVRTDVTNRRREAAARAQDLVSAQEEMRRLEERIRLATERDAAARAELEAATAKAVEVAGPEAEAELARKRQGFLDEQRSAEARGRWQAQHHAAEQRRQQAERTVEEIGAQVAALTAEIDGCETEKRELLASAVMPVPGLVVTEDGIRLNDQPWAQASQAEKISVALAVTMAESPNLKDIWGEDGSLLDDDSLELIRKTCDAKGMRAWIERVGEDDEDAIVIREGVVVDDAGE